MVVLTPISGPMWYEYMRLTIHPYQLVFFWVGEEADGMSE
jgi:hypothetical protein